MFALRHTSAVKENLRWYKGIEVCPGASEIAGKLSPAHCLLQSSCYPVAVPSHRGQVESTESRCSLCPGSASGLDDFQKSLSSLVFDNAVIKFEQIKKKYNFFPPE